MKHLLIILLAFHSVLNAQELQLTKATKQQINHGAAPGSTINYTVMLKKDKNFKWSIDSVHTPLGKSLKFNVVKVDDMNATSPNYQAVKCYCKKDKGNYQITFSTNKKRGGGRPNSPPNNMVEVEDFNSGAIIFYTVKGKVKQLKIESFEELETVNAP